MRMTLLTLAMGVLPSVEEARGTRGIDGAETTNGLPPRQTSEERPRSRYNARADERAPPVPPPERRLDQRRDGDQPSARPRARPAPGLLLRGRFRNGRLRGRVPHPEP